MSVAARQMLHALGVLHSHGVSCNGKLKASSFCLLPDGRLKLGALFHFDIPPKKNMEFAISQDLHALLEAVEEVHEIGEALIPLYLTFHVGSVIVHSMAGNPIWKRMWQFRARPGQESTTSPMEGDHNLV